MKAEKFSFFVFADQQKFCIFLLRVFTEKTFQKVRSREQNLPLFELHELQP